MTNFRITIITNGNYFARLGLDRLVKEKHNQINGIVLVTGIKADRSRFRSLVEILQQTGIQYFLYKSSTYIVFALARLIFPKRAFFVPDLVKPYNIPIIYAAQVNDPKVIQWIKSLQPDLLISVSCPQRIEETILDIPLKYSINIHSSLLPAYAGLAPYFWVLANGEKITGTTVHIMEEKFDTGTILAQRQVEISGDTTLFSLFFQTSYEGSYALFEAVSGLEDGTARFTAQDHSKRSYNSWPTVEANRKIRENGHQLVTWANFVHAIKSVK